MFVQQTLGGNIINLINLHITNPIAYTIQKYVIYTIVHIAGQPTVTNATFAGGDI